MDEGMERGGGKKPGWSDECRSGERWQDGIWRELWGGGGQMDEGARRNERMSGREGGTKKTEEGGGGGGSGGITNRPACRNG